MSADLDQNNEINVLDVMKVVNIILDQSIAISEELELQITFKFENDLTKFNPNILNIIKTKKAPNLDAFKK